MRPDETWNNNIIIIIISNNNNNYYYYDYYEAQSNNASVVTVPLGCNKIDLPRNNSQDLKCWDPDH